MGICGMVHKGVREEEILSFWLERAEGQKALSHPSKAKRIGR
jgi:hypothetical protein